VWALGVITSHISDSQEGAGEEIAPETM
jgi:hypothetical protein